jgi:hypothetical protein
MLDTRVAKYAPALMLEYAFITFIIIRIYVRNLYEGVTLSDGETATII